MTNRVQAKWERFSRDSAGDDITDFFILSDHVLRLSTRTLIHRAVPNPPGSPTTFTDECIQIARETLARHQECMAVVERTTAGLFSTYMNWYDTLNASAQHVGLTSQDNTLRPVRPLYRRLLPSNRNPGQNGFSSFRSLRRLPPATPYSHRSRRQVSSPFTGAL